MVSQPWLGSLVVSGSPPTPPCEKRFQQIHPSTKQPQLHSPRQTHAMCDLELQLFLKHINLKVTSLTNCVNKCELFTQTFHTSNNTNVRK